MLKEFPSKYASLALLVTCLLFFALSWLALDLSREIGDNTRLIHDCGLIRGDLERLMQPDLPEGRNKQILERLEGMLANLFSPAFTRENVPPDDLGFKQSLVAIQKLWPRLREAFHNSLSGSAPSDLSALGDEYVAHLDALTAAALGQTERWTLSFDFRVKSADLAFILVALVIGIALVNLRTFRKRAENLGTLANVDSMTEIPNRAACNQKIAHLSNTSTTGDLAVFLFDMNNLKRANIELGREQVDQIIVGFAHILRQNFPGDSFIGRYGGDEFLVIAENTDYNQSVRLVENLRHLVITHNQGVDHNCKHIDYSTGFSSGNRQKNSVENILLAADCNLAEQKRNSRESIMASLVEQVTDASRELLDVATSVSSSSHELADSANKERNLLADFSTATQTLHRHAEENSSLADESSRIIADIRQRALTGNGEMDKLSLSMTAIADTAKRIHGIMKAIDDIAFQTNILSLNAAVEAAHAGSSGKGFAVVADEVRTLANRSALSVESTDEVLAESSANVRRGVELSRTTSEHLHWIVDTTDTANHVMENVSNKAKEQKNVLAGMVSALTEVREITGGNSKAAQENADTARKLLAMANRMNKLLDMGVEAKNQDDD
ncbi:MAG: methyl-accepting chemotaxis protein [Planctomycetota bacterium]|jgi:diguanylate cyclase (GGDEF)-like protein|nr:methyl-accepting chemotaxis protein [Planctomycetota bacterium]